MSPNPRQLLHPKYRPDIDGLRAIAVLSVVGYHAFPGWVPGGYTGVDVFFVISGFLISTIIFGNLERDSFSYAEFYARRIKRIFPAILVVLFATTLFGWYVLFLDEFQQLGKHVAGGAGFISNIVLWGESGYFDAAAETKPLLHLWSLGIEEQFYIIWPLVLGYVWKKNLNIFRITLLVTIVSFAMNAYWVEIDPIADFYLPFSRAWELMIGGLLAYLVLHRPQYFTSNNISLSMLPLFGLLLISISVGLFNKSISFPGWWAFFPTIGASLIIASRPTAWVNKYILSNRVMVWVGTISYPLYLWHWPLLSYARIIEGGTPNRLIRIAVVVTSIVLAWGTYELIEKRFKKGYSKLAIFCLSSLMALFLVFGMLIWKGFPLPRHSSEFANQMVAAVNDWAWPGELEPVEYGEHDLYIRKGAKAKTLFFGDSLLQQYAPRVVRLLNENQNLNTAVFAAGGGCPPIPHVYENKHHWCPSIRDSALKYMERDDVKTIVIGGAWWAYFVGQTRKTHGNGTRNYSYYYKSTNYEQHGFKGGGGAELAMQELESLLEKIAKTKQVFLLLDNPSGKIFSPKSHFSGSRLTTIQQKSVMNEYSVMNLDPEHSGLRQSLKAIANRTGAIIIDPFLYLCSEQKCKVTTKTGDPIYKDGGHLRSLFVEQEATFIDVTLQ